MTTAAGLGGAFAGAVLLGLGAIIDRLDLLRRQGRTTARRNRPRRPSPP